MGADKTYLVVKSLLDAAETDITRDRASAAVTACEKCLKAAPEDPEFHNWLGSSLLQRAWLEPYAEAVQTLKKAAAEFETASRASKDGLPPAVYCRYRINLANVLWVLGERLGDDNANLEAVEILQSASKVLSQDFPDWGRAQDNLGNALRLLGRNVEAVKAYKAAGNASKDPAMKARVRSNLAVAYVEASINSDDPITANRHLRRAFKEFDELQKMAMPPPAWARNKNNLGMAWLQKSRITKHQPKSSLQALEAQAVVAFEEALKERQLDRSPVDWASTTANLAMALASLGETISRNPNSDRSTGLSHIERSIKLYKDAFPNLPAVAGTIAAQNLLVVLDLLKHVSGNTEVLEVIEHHHIDIMELSVQLENDEVFSYAKDGLKATINEILSLPTNARILIGVDKYAAIITDIISVLVSSGIPRAEWPEIFAQVLSRAEAIPETKRGHVTEARGAARAATSRTMDNHPLPNLPPGLAWPKETYSGSPEAKRGGGGIVAYLDRVWLPLLKAAPGVVDLRTLRSVDPSAAMGINNHKRGGHALPPHLDIPTKAETVDRALTAPVVSLRDAARLSRAAYRRGIHHK